MAAKKKPAAESQPPEEDALEEEALHVYGPYELVEDVNSLSFGADPLITLLSGESYSTSEPGVALFLDEHPAVRKASA